MTCSGSSSVPFYSAFRYWAYITGEAARLDVFDCIEMFYNPKRKHTTDGMLSPVDFEARQKKLNKAGV